MSTLFARCKNISLHKTHVKSIVSLPAIFVLNKTSDQAWLGEVRFRNFELRLAIGKHIFPANFLLVVYLTRGFGFTVLVIFLDRFFGFCT